MKYIFKDQLEASLEAIQYQKDIKIVDDISKIFTNIRITIRNNRNRIDRIKEIEKKAKFIDNLIKQETNKLEEIINKRFGIPFRIRSDETTAIMVIVPPLDNQDMSLTREDILNIEEEIKDMENDPDYSAEIKKYKHMLTTFTHTSEIYRYFSKNNITVDFKNAKIENWPNDLRPYLMMDYYSFTFNFSNVTEREMVAILLHEIGHQFHSIATLSNTISTSTILVDAALEYISNGKNIDKLKIKILESIDDDDVREILEKEDNMLVWGSKTYIYHINKLANITNNPETRRRNFEKEADNFPIRFGLGYEIGSSLEKIYRTFTTDSIMLNTFGLVVNVVLTITIFAVYVNMSIILAVIMNAVFKTSFSIIISFLKFFIFSIIFFTVISLVVYFLFSEVNIMDVELIPHPEYRRRLRSIKKKMIELLRQTNISDKDKKNTIKNIELLEDILDKTSNYDMDLFRKISRLILPWSRGAVADARLNDVLEELMNSDLYLRAQQLRG